jgi:hypothetical protein
VTNFYLGPVAASLDIFRTPTPTWQTVSQTRDDAMSGKGTPSKQQQCSILLLDFFEPQAHVPNRFTQCQRRGTPERDDTKPSREKNMSLSLGGMNDFLQLRVGNFTRKSQQATKVFLLGLRL